MQTTSVAQLLAMMPEWMGWTACLFIPLALVVSYLSATLTTRFVLRTVSLPPALSWHERARRLYPARLNAGLYAAMLPALFGGLVASALGPLTSPKRESLAVLTAAASLLGVLLSAYQYARIFRGARPSLGQFAKDVAGMGLLFMPQIGVLPWLMAWTASAWTPSSVAAVIVAAVAALFFGAGGALVLMRALGISESAPERVTNLWERLGGNPAQVDVLQVTWANAVAFPVAGRMAVTRGAIDALSDDELSAFMAHEQGHLQEPKSWARVRVASGLLLGPMILAARPLIGTWGWGGLGWIFCGALVLAAAARKVLEQAESRADEHASAQVDAETYARALCKVYERNALPLVTGTGRASQRDLYDRLVALKVLPAETVPPTPPSLRPLRWIPLVHVVSVVSVMVVVQVVVPSLWIRSNGPSGSEIAVAVTGGRPSALIRYADYRYQAGAYDEAATWYALVASMRGLPEDHTRLCVALARLGRCVEAERVFSRAESLGAEALYLEDASVALDECLVMDRPPSASIE